MPQISNTMPSEVAKGHATAKCKNHCGLTRLSVPEPCSVFVLAARELGKYQRSRLAGGLFGPHNLTPEYLHKNRGFARKMQTPTSIVVDKAAKLANGSTILPVKTHVGAPLTWMSENYLLDFWKPAPHPQDTLPLPSLWISTPSAADSRANPCPMAST